MSDYLTILVRADIDRFGHNAVFADEIAAALARRGVSSRTIDYIADAAGTHRALLDRHCRSFICFNGFGSEIKIVGKNRLMPAFEAVGKPLFDLMHDCPAHETMQHQVDSRFTLRRLLSTDPAYASVAQRLGVRNVWHVPSITFPRTAPPEPRPTRERSIGILLPIGLSDPSRPAARHGGSGLRSRVFRQVFESAAEACLADWSLDPLSEIEARLAEIGIPADYGSVDIRFLTSTTTDFVKFTRRRALVDAVKGLPVTLVTEDYAKISLPEGMQRRSPTTFRELIGLMGDAKIVLSPQPHLYGFHERPLAALSASAALVSSPTHVLAASLTHGVDFLMGSGPAEMARMAGWLLSDPARAQAIAASGHETATRLFPPDRLVSTILNLIEVDFRLKFGT